MSRRMTMVLALALSVSVIVSMASAGSIHGALEIEASSSVGTGSVQYDIPALEGGSVVWTLNEDTPITDTQTGNTVATVLAGTTFTAVADPVLGLTLNMSAGAADTVVTVNTPRLDFPTIDEALGKASAGTVVVDFNGNGAWVNGGFPGPASYRAVYYGDLPVGTVFANMVGNSHVNSAFASMKVAEEFPAVNAFQAIGAVSSIDAGLSFTLSATDFVVANSVFSVIPEPGTAGLLLMAGVCLCGSARRRK